MGIFDSIGSAFSGAVKGASKAAGGAVSWAQDRAGEASKVVGDIATGVSSAILGKEITEDDVYKATGKAQPQDIRKMIKYATTGAFKESRKLLLELLIKQGLAAQDIIRQIHREAIVMPDIDDKTKVEMIKMIGEVDFRLTEGSNPEIQLSALLAHLVGLQLD